MERTRMVQRSMSAGASTQCLPTEIPDGTTNSLRDAEGNSGLAIGGKWIITQFFLDRVKNAHTKFPYTGTCLEEVISSALVMDARREMKWLDSIGGVLIRALGL